MKLQIRHSLKRRLIFFIATLPMVGRNNYERMNQRLDRQIKIRNEKRKNTKRVKFVSSPLTDYFSKTSTSFDNIEKVHNIAVSC